MRFMMSNGEESPELYLGKYKGFVRDNADPERRGRIRVYCPQVMGKEDAPDFWLDWAEPNFPWFGGATNVIMGTPPTRLQAGAEVGVWIEFEAGNPDFPIWTGSFTIAPTEEDGAIRPTTVEGFAAGGVLPSPPNDSEVDELYPVRFGSDDFLFKTLAILQDKERDIVIACKNGGAIILGPSGVHIVGVQVTINGRVAGYSRGKLSF